MPPNSSSSSSRSSSKSNTHELAQEIVLDCSENTVPGVPYFLRFWVLVPGPSAPGPSWQFNARRSLRICVLIHCSFCVLIHCSVFAVSLIVIFVVAFINHVLIHCSFCCLVPCSSPCSAPKVHSPMFCGLVGQGPRTQGNQISGLNRVKNSE